MASSVMKCEQIERRMEILNKTLHFGNTKISDIIEKRLRKITPSGYIQIRELEKLLCIAIR